MKTFAWIDPVVEEVRQAREEIMKECNYDLKVLAERLKRLELMHPERLSKRVPSKIQLPKKPSA